MQRKELVTAEHIRLARLAGETEVFFGKGAIITQQAQDDAKHYGIHLRLRAESPVPEYERQSQGNFPAAPRENPRLQSALQAVSSAVPAQPEHAQPEIQSVQIRHGQSQSVSVDADALRNLLASLQTPSAIAAQTVPAIRQQTQIAQPEPVLIQPALSKSDSALLSAPQAAYAPGQMASPDAEEALIMQVQAQVRALLPAGIQVDDSCIARAIHQVLDSVSRPQEIRPGVQKAHGITHVSADSQNWRRTPGIKESLTMMEVLSPALGDLTAVGYLEWEMMTVPWTFRRPEVLVILEGTLNLFIEGTRFTAKTGDVFSFPGNAGVQMQTREHVKCVTVACMPESKA